MPYWFATPENQSYVSSGTYSPDRDEHAFTPEECDRLLEMGLSGGPLSPGTVVDSGRGDLLDERSRLVSKRPISCEPESNWLYERLTTMILEANARWWRFDLVGLVEDLEFLRYEAGGHFVLHPDFMAGSASRRKISLSVQLSDPRSYDEGGLEILGTERTVASRERGSVTLFPSYVLHRVLPVTAGVRFAIVGWVYGPPFR